MYTHSTQAYPSHISNSYTHYSHSHTSHTCTLTHMHTESHSTDTHKTFAHFLVWQSIKSTTKSPHKVHGMLLHDIKGREAA